MTDLEQLEQQRADAKALIHVRQMAFRLSQNSDFKELILNGFCRDEAARYAQEAGDPALGANERADALNMAMASGHLKRFLQACVQMGAHAERTFAELEAEIDAARAEEAGGE